MVLGWDSLLDNINNVEVWRPLEVGSWHPGILAWFTGGDPLADAWARGGDVGVM